MMELIVSFSVGILCGMVMIGLCVILPHIEDDENTDKTDKKDDI